jgi:hypothetical protein
MPNPKLNTEFVITIPHKNDRGEVVSEKQYVLFAGLLALAHELGLERIDTQLVQVPTADNGQCAIVRAVAAGKPGTFAGLGDASPANTSRAVARHLIRVAETRAKARALRDLTNVSLVAFEELGGDDEADDRARHVVSLPSKGRAAAPASDGQRRTLFRLAYELGHAGRDAAAFLGQRLGTNVDRANREAASSLIDQLVAELRQRSTERGDHAAE